MPRGPKHKDRGWRDWYQLCRWRRIAKAQLRAEPLCKACLDRGIVTPATIADHITHHDGDWNRFILGELQSLCEPCHREKHNTVRYYSKRITYGLDGWPVAS